MSVSIFDIIDEKDEPNDAHGFFATSNHIINISLMGMFMVVCLYINRKLPLNSSRSDVSNNIM
jgi:hypothetical protein